MAKMIESRIHHDELQLLDSTKLEIDQSSTDKQTTLFQKGPFKSTLSNKRQRPGNLNIIHKRFFPIRLCYKLEADEPKNHSQFFCLMTIGCRLTYMLRTGRVTVVIK